jgi:hypothetical protein
MQTLSQGHLNILATCPRKYQYLYLDHLLAPVTHEQQQRMTWGTQFHRIMQQWQLGLPMEPLLAHHPNLQACFQALQQAVPPLFERPMFERPNLQQPNLQWPDGDTELEISEIKPSYCASEQARSLAIGDDVLLVVYDLLWVQGEQAQIIDWKTYPRPQNSRWLAQNWQTRLYPYVLVETSDYTPEQVSMSYWFVQAPKVQAQPDQNGQPNDGQPNDGQPNADEKPDSLGDVHPQMLKFSYDASQHHQTQEDLLQLLKQLDQWHQAYRDQGQAFPQVDLDQGLCPSCPFGERCQRGDSHLLSQTESITLRDLLDIAEIPELPIPNPTQI